PPGAAPSPTASWAGEAAPPPGPGAATNRRGIQKGGKEPGGAGPWALGPPGRGEGVAGARAALAPGAWPPGPGVGRAPRLDLVPVAPGTLAEASVPPSGVAGGWTGCGAAAWGDMGEHRPKAASPEARERLGPEVEMLTSGSAIPADGLIVNGLLALWPSIGLYDRSSHHPIMYDSACMKA